VNQQIAFFQRVTDLPMEGIHLFIRFAEIAMIGIL
jgi:hypothetical protein